MSSFAAARKQAHQAPRPVQRGRRHRRPQAGTVARETNATLYWRKNTDRTVVRICNSTRETTINYYWLRAKHDSAPRLSAICNTNHIDIVMFLYRLSAVALQLVLHSSSTHALMLDNLPQHRDPSAAEDSHSRTYSHQSIRRCG